MSYFKIQVMKECNYKLPVLYGCDTWSLTLKKEHGLMVFENMVPRMILWPKREGQETGENCIVRSFMIHTPCPILG